MIELDYIVVGLALMLLYFVYFMVSKDSQQSRKIRSIASAVEELHRQVYKMEKRFSDEIEQLASMEPPMSRSEIEHRLEKDMVAMATPVAERLEEMQSELEELRTSLPKRLHHIEDAMRSLTMPSSVGSMDDQKIIALYQQGIPLDTIAKELHLSKPEVEFVLKINKIR